MRSEITNYNFNSFNVPLYSNVTAKKCSRDTIDKLLVEQVISKVRWRESIEFMLKDGVNEFIEIGPGKVLTGLVKRTSDKAVTESINKIDDIKKLND